MAYKILKVSHRFVGAKVYVTVTAINMIIAHVGRKLIFRLQTEGAVTGAKGALVDSGEIWAGPAGFGATIEYTFDHDIWGEDMIEHVWVETYVPNPPLPGLLLEEKDYMTYRIGIDVPEGEEVVEEVERTVEEFAWEPIKTMEWLLIGIGVLVAAYVAFSIVTVVVRPKKSISHSFT